MKKLYRIVYPNHVIYILAHVIVFLVGLILTLKNDNSTFLYAIGVSLISAAIAGWIIFVYVFVSEKTKQKLELITDFGFVDAFEARAVRIRDEYDKRISKAHNIDIMGFGLRALREDYKEQFAIWKQRGNVRILLLDPNFPTTCNAYALQRDLEENTSTGTIRADVEEFVSSCEDLVKEKGAHKFEIHLYKCLPSVNIFRIDDELFWGPYLIREQSRNCPTFLVRRGVLYDRLCKHFELIWTDEKLSSPVKYEPIQATK